MRSSRRRRLRLQRKYARASDGKRYSVNTIRSNDDLFKAARRSGASVESLKTIVVRTMLGFQKNVAAFPGSPAGGNRLFPRT